MFGFKWKDWLSDSSVWVSHEDWQTGLKMLRIHALSSMPIDENEKSEQVALRGWGKVDEHWVQNLQWYHW